MHYVWLCIALQKSQKSYKEIELENKNQVKKSLIFYFI